MSIVRFHAASRPPSSTEPDEPDERLREAQNQIGREAQNQVGRGAQTAPPPTASIVYHETGSTAKASARLQSPAAAVPGWAIAEPAAEARASPHPRA